MTSAGVPVTLSAVRRIIRYRLCPLSIFKPKAIRISLIRQISM